MNNNLLRKDESPCVYFQGADLNQKEIYIYIFFVRLVIKLWDSVPYAWMLLGG